jgi:hypothetical protein
MKKSSAKKNDKDKDRKRLMALSKDSFDDVWAYDGKSFPEHVCRYMIGIFYEVNIRKRKVTIEYYKQGMLLRKYEVAF